MLGPGDEYSLGCIDTEEYSWKKTGKNLDGRTSFRGLCKDWFKVARGAFQHFESGSHYMMIDICIYMNISYYMLC